VVVTVRDAEGVTVLDDNDMHGVEENGSGEGRGALSDGEGEQTNETSIVTLSQSHNKI
jgi:hypothetical protein